MTQDFKNYFFLKTDQSSRLARLSQHNFSAPPPYPNSNYTFVLVKYFMVRSLNFVMCLYYGNMTWFLTINESKYEDTCLIKVECKAIDLTKNFECFFLLNW